MKIIIDGTSFKENAKPGEVVEVNKEFATCYGIKSRIAPAANLPATFWLKKEIINK